MAGLAATFRLLYSAETSFERKLEAAESLVAVLLDCASNPAPAAAAGLPPLVRAHYLRSLLEWSCGAVTKKAGEPAGDSRKAKKRKQEAGADAEGAAGTASRPPRLQPRCWVLLVSVLGSSATPASQPLPAALLPAATAALQALHQGELTARDAAEAAALLSPLAALLTLLAGKFAGSFRPSIEHAAAAAEAALSGEAAAAHSTARSDGTASEAVQAWEAVAAGAVQLLLAAAGGHPNKRKVWDATVPRPLPLLAGAGFRGSASGDSCHTKLAGLCQQALEAVLFNPQHVPQLAAAAAAQMAAAVAEAEAKAGGVGAAEGVAAKGSGDAQQGAAGYAAHLFATLRQLLDERRLTLALLPWMAGRFCAAVRQQRRAAETEAAITGQAGKRRQQTGGGDEAPGGDGGSAGSDAAARPGGAAGGLAASADFHFWVALLSTLLPQVQRLRGKGSRDDGGAELAEAVSGVAGLAAALRGQQLYRPTQDPAGQHRLLLQHLAEAALQLAQEQAQAGGGGGTAAAVLPAALGVLQGILAVEHRAIQQQLPQLLPLLLWSPSDAGGASEGGVAAEVAGSLVAAFAELRQLEVLLQSLTAALLLPDPVGQQGGAEAAAAAAAGVLHSGAFQAALAAAVRQLPSGQVPMVLRLAAQAVEQLAGSGSSKAGQLLVLDLYSACLASLAVDLTTAAAAAAAAQALVTALSPALLPLLAAAAASPAGGGSSKEGKKKSKKHGEAGVRAGLLPALLRLYRRALAVHERCAAMHPEVAPLPGRHLQPAAAEVEAAPSLPGYFAPLLEGREAALPAPALGDLVGSVGSGSSDGELRHALLHAAEQQLQLRHWQLQYMVHTCPVTLLPPPGAEGQEEEEAEEGEAAQRAQQAQQARQQQLELRLAAERRQAESELQQLAGFIASAAAKEAADSSPRKPAALLLAARSLPVLQAWAAPLLLQTLLQACLRQAVTDGSAGLHKERQRLCRQLLLGGDLLEQPRLAALLPAAAAAEQASALRAVLEAEATAAENGEEGAPSKKRRKKERLGDAAAAAAAADCDGSAGSGGHAASMLQQLTRLAKGKAVKSGAWAAAVQGCSAEIAALADSSSIQRSNSGKRKQQRGIGEEPASAAAALQSVQQQAELLAQLPLSHLQPEAAASMAALSLGALLQCCRTSLAQQQQWAGPAALRAAVGCIAVLARLADDGLSGSGGLASQLQLPPQALKAALQALACAAAGCGSDASGAAAQYLAAAAEHSRAAMQAVCAAHLAAADSSSMQQLSEALCSHLAQGPLEGRWAASVLAKACLAACREAARPPGSRAGIKAVADIVCGSSAQPAFGPAAAAAAGAAAARLEAAVAAALPGAAAYAPDSWQQAALAGALYGCSAQLLRLHCCEGPAADELARHQTAGCSGCISGMADALLAAAGLLERLLSPAEWQDGMQGHSAASLLVQPLLKYVAACCAATGRMRPAASSRHYASLLALLLHLLARVPVGGAGLIPPSRQVLPFAAAFPAAAAEVLAAQRSVLEGHARAGGVRPLLLQALRELVAGSSSQQLLLPLRYVEATLPGLPAASGAALPLCELLLVLLEAASGSQQQRLLGQHSERIAALLTAFISAATCAAPVQQRSQQPLDSPQQLAAAVLAAAAAEGGSAGAVSADAAAALAAPSTPPMHEPFTAASASPVEAEVATLCTALRVLESLAARPKLLPLPPAAVCSMLSCVTAVWTSYAERPQQSAWPGGRAAEAPLPGFRYRLDVSTGAGLFAGSCHLLLALLRHRAQDLRRCLPLLLQALRALLRFLAAAELSHKLQRLVLAPAGVLGASSAQPGQQEQRWRVKCAELLATALAEMAALKDAAVGRYCPQLLADYLILAAAPPSGRSKALLHFCSPAAALAARCTSHPGSQGGGSVSVAAAAAAAAAEEDALAGEPLSPGVAAALRRGASALYGACSASEIQFLYASLGTSGSGAASWRGALAALKSDYEKHFKYTGKV